MASLNTPFQQALCIYCYKSATQNLTEVPFEIHKHFLKLISRHLNYDEKGKVLAVFGQCPPKPCNDCLGVLTNFCELYHQLKCLELKLNWQVDKLWNVMRWADRVPSRLKSFRNSDDFERKFEFRNSFKMKCKQHFSDQLPRVSLPVILNRENDVFSAEVQEDRNDINSHHDENNSQAMETMENELLENKCDGIDNNDNDDDKSPDNCSSNDTDFEKEPSCVSDANLIHQEEEEASSEMVMSPAAASLSPIVSEENGPILNVKTDLTSQYQVPMSMLKDQTPFKIGSDPIQIPLELSSLKQDVYQEEKPGLTRRSLRTKLQCSQCKRTFSNGNRFKIHTNSCKQSSETESDTSDTEEENVKVKSEIDEMSSRTPSNFGNAKKRSRKSNGGGTSDLELPYTSSSSGEEIDDLDKKKGNQRKYKPSYLCNKCTPPKFYKSKLHDIYKHSKGHLHLNVATLKRLKLTINSLKLDGISLETRYECTLDPDQCSKSYPIPKELETHTRLHGSFACPICDLCFNQALDLINHELEHSNDKLLAEDKDFQKGETFHCARCDYKTVAKAEIVNHCLKEHLGMAEMESQCPICQQTFPNFDTVPLKHYINYHDLNRLDDPEEKITCTQLDCHAYFLTEDQLHVHSNREHGSLEIKAAEEKKITRMKNCASKKKLEKKSNSCPHCPRKFQIPNHLRLHILGQHLKESGFQDAEVTKGERSITKAGLTVDDIVLEKNAIYFCKINGCEDKFRNEEDFKSHSKLHGEFPCNFCETVCTFATDLATHETVHIENVTQTKKRVIPQRVTFRCSRCPFITGRKGRYVDHFVWQHLGLVVDKKKCPVCRHAFPFCCSVSTRKNHEFRKQIYQHYIEWHDFTGVEGGEEGAFKCDKCPAYFRTNLQLIQHTDQVHDSPCNNLEYVESNECCGMNFANYKALGHHRRKVHKVELKFACDVPECDKKFETTKELIHHNNRVHFGDTSGERKFSCGECEKKYFTKIALLSHVKAHKQSKSSCVCEQCGKSFKDKTCLEVHYKFHDGPESWDFSCEICGKKIYSQQKLTEHMRVHTKEKPFVCQVCGVAYGHRHNLRIHVNSKHKEIQDVARKCDVINLGSSRKGKKLK